MGLDYIALTAPLLLNALSLSHCSKLCSYFKKMLVAIKSSNEIMKITFNQRNTVRFSVLTIIHIVRVIEYIYTLNMLLLCSIFLWYTHIDENNPGKMS